VAIHTGVVKSNSVILTLVVPPDGTYVTKAPFFVDEFAKFNFLIDIQIDQFINKGHNFRCEIGQPTVKDDKSSL